jgi:hypothetical protein
VTSNSSFPETRQVTDAPSLPLTSKSPVVPELGTFEPATKFIVNGGEQKPLVAVRELVTAMDTAPSGGGATASPQDAVEIAESNIKNL